MHFYVQVTRHATNPHSYLLEGSLTWIQRENATPLERAVLDCVGDNIEPGTTATVRVAMSRTLTCVVDG